MEPFTDSHDHLAAELARLDVLLQRELRLVRLIAPPASDDELRGLVITEDEIDRVAELRSLLLERDRQQAAHGAALRSFDDLAFAMRTEIDGRLDAARRSGRTPALRAFADRFQLTAPETDLVLIALAPEIENRYETLYAYLQNDITRKRPSVDLALNVLTRSVRQKLCWRTLLLPDAPLVARQIVVLADEPHDRDPSAPRRFLKLDPALVGRLIGQIGGPSAAEASAADGDAIRDLPIETQADLQRLAKCLARAAGGAAAVVLEGERAETLHSAARWLAASLGRAVLVAGVGREPNPIPIAVRDALASGSILVLDMFESAADKDAAPGVRPAARRPFAGFEDLVIVLTRPGMPFGDLPAAETLWRLEIPPPAFARRLEIWEQEAGALTTLTERARLADTFRFDRDSVRRAVSLARGLGTLGEPAARTSPASALFEAGRLMTTPSLQRFAARRIPRHGWQDLILPPQRLEQLERLVSWMRHRHHVYESWGFGRKVAASRGLSVLFAGPSGTGKTLAAEVLASELALDLYQIDLSSVVSKYIGETEKHLSAIFEEAERSQAILFFDEADALFGKRTEVKDAHDRYANIEVNFLLQRVERYDGLVVLASNLQRNLDEAFLRRLHDVVDFPFPDASDRERLWRGHVPAAARIQPDVDFVFLARQFKITGGSIRNIVLDAAFRAAAAAGSIGMGELIQAARTELQKQGRVPTRAEFGPYYDSLHSGEPAAPLVGR